MLKNIPQEIAASFALAIILLAFPQDAQAVQKHRRPSKPIIHDDAGTCIAKANVAPKGWAREGQFACSIAKGTDHTLDGGNLSVGIFRIGPNGIPVTGIEITRYADVLDVNSWAGRRTENHVSYQIGNCKDDLRPIRAIIRNQVPVACKGPQ